MKTIPGTRKQVTKPKSMPTGAAVKLTPAFLALADRFGMVPARLADRVLAEFVRESPRELQIKAAPRR